ncbi:SixA phosphatase family protein [Pseudobdellovibrio exovorus]|uniref:Phosphohistidine phosphatase n=1 Tax=Pseudobdellovibrio exovorus JSS TaxID=1184267 RepID=M4VBU6_9BACT|nr:histidine phosphatase family protein [Pseudobdellovibrio exovorus]AGH95960.1 hypothetical protein A11Q_1744 [Pseudobdellovibrio exovorus JSS]
MTKTLIFVRHAKALDRAVALIKKIKEAQRPLTEEGIEEFRKQVKKNKKVFKEVELFITSPYLRAAQTLDILLEGLELKEAFIESNSLIEPDKNPIEFLKWLQDRGEECVVAVSHEPFLSNCLKSIFKKETDFIKIKKGAIVVIKYQKDQKKYQLVNIF